MAEYSDSLTNVAEDERGRRAVPRVFWRPPFATQRVGHPWRATGWATRPITMVYRSFVAWHSACMTWPKVAVENLYRHRPASLTFASWNHQRMAEAYWRRAASTL